MNALTLCKVLGASGSVATVWAMIWIAATEIILRSAFGR